MYKSFSLLIWKVFGIRKMSSCTILTPNLEVKQESSSFAINPSFVLVSGRVHNFRGILKNFIMILLRVREFSFYLCCIFHEKVWVVLKQYLFLLDYEIKCNSSICCLFRETTFGYKLVTSTYILAREQIR